MALSSVFLPQELIRRKRDNLVLSEPDISRFVTGITDGSVTDAQIASFAMAVFFNGMTPEEGAALTLSMRDSGDVICWQDYGFDKDAPIVDKHSTGGVGDKVSFMLVAIVAACGGFVPMIAGRGLGHTGGTVDKLEAIPGYDVMLDASSFAAVTKKIGCSIIGQTSNLAPADKRFYAVRDVTATVESVPLITASILSKKLAAGLSSSVMDVKFGNGAFMDTREKALVLGQNLVRVATAAGVPTTAVLTDMNQVLGTTVGNAVEILETIEFLNQPVSADARLKEVTLTLAAEMLMCSGLAPSFDEGLIVAETALNSGAAADKFSQMVEAHGGPSDLLENPASYLTVAPFTKDIHTAHEGYLASVNTYGIGQVIVAMGGGRKQPSEKIDLSVGLSNFATIGDAVSKNEPICIIHASSTGQIEMAEKMILDAVRVSSEKPAIDPVLADTIR